MPTFIVTQTKTWTIHAQNKKAAILIAGKLRDHPHTEEFTAQQGFVVGAPELNE